MRMPSWILVHGATTHFPIVLLFVAAGCELAALAFPASSGETGAGRRRWLRQVSLFTLALGVLGAAPSILSGYLYGRNLRFAPAEYDLHWKLGAVSSALAALALIWRLCARDQLGAAARATVTLLLLLSAAVVAVTGKLGGEMVFGSGEDTPESAVAVPAPAPVAATPTERTTVVTKPAAPGSVAKLDAAAGRMASAAGRLDSASNRLDAATRNPIVVPAAPVAPVPAANPAAGASLERAAARLNSAADRYDRVAGRLERVAGRLDALPHARVGTTPQAVSPALSAGQGTVRAVATPGAKQNPPAQRTTVPPGSGLDPAQVERGRVLVASDDMGCLNCHRLGGKGGRSAPALDGVGREFPDPDWQLRHLKNPAGVVPGSKMPAYDWEKEPTLKEAEVRAMAQYMASLK